MRAFPTLRWYDNKKAQAPDYKSDRTVQALVSFVRRKLDLNEKFKDWDKKKDGKNEKYRELYNVPENPGCQVSGTLMGKLSTLWVFVCNITHDIDLTMPIPDACNYSESCTW